MDTVHYNLNAFFTNAVQQQIPDWERPPGDLRQETLSKGQW